MRYGYKARVLITVKTYPHPSERYEEIVCTAGITQDGEWVRLYPINYRGLDFRRALSAYQWIELVLEPAGHGNDRRAESRRPNMETLEICGEPLSEKDNWRARKAIVDQMPVYTFAELVARSDSEHRSLGVVRPSRVYDILVEETSRQWSPQQLGLMDELALSDGTEHPGRPFRKLPFEFRCVFQCEGDIRPHRSLITDWELGVFYFKEERRLGDPNLAAQSVKDRFLTELCGRDKETLFFMGATGSGDDWCTHGVFYPEREAQLSLLD